MTGFIDTNIFIYAATDHPEFAPKAKGILKRVEEGERALTSTMVLCEVAWVLEASGKQALIKTTLEKIFSYDHLEIEGFELDDMLVASNTLLKYDLDFNDAINLAIMEKQGLNKVYSNDKKHLGSIEFIERVF
jgi:predicted nucleic acid-binding protein